MNKRILSLIIAVMMSLMLMIPADAVSGIETVKTVEFDMRLVNAETEEEIVTLPASARMQ